MEQLEDKILNLLNKLGETYQSHLVIATGSSRSRVSEVLSALESKNIITRIPEGRNLRVILNVPMIKKVRRVKGRIRLGFTRAAEYGFLIPFKRLLNYSGMSVEFHVYGNGINVLRDLFLSRLDLAIAPILTQFIFYSIGAPISILAPAGSGGSSIILRKGAELSKERSSVTLTKLSTMELLFRSSLNDCVLTNVGKTIYASSPEEMVQSIIRSKVDAACIWEPYATILERGGSKRLIRYSEIQDHLCCVLSAGGGVDDAIKRKISKLLKKSIEIFNGNRENYVLAYSALVGLDSNLLSRVIDEYSYPEELDSLMLYKQLEHAGITVPSISSLKEAIYVN